MRAYNKEICPILKVDIMEDFSKLTLELTTLQEPRSIKQIKEDTGVFVGKCLGKNIQEKGTTNQKPLRQERNNVFLLISFINC